MVRTSPASSITTWLEGLPNCLLEQGANPDPDPHTQPRSPRSRNGGRQLKRTREALGEMSSTRS
jgi:hypothetical protein